MATYSENIALALYRSLRALENEGLGFLEMDADKGMIHFITNHLIFRFFLSFYILKDSYVLSALCYVDESEDDESESYIPLKVDLENVKQVNEMAKFLCWLNNKLVFGSFIINRSDGGINYRWGVSCDHEEIPTKAFANCLTKPMELFEEYELSMRKIIDDDYTAEEAME